MHLMQLMTALADHIQRDAVPTLLLYVYLICALTCKMSIACVECSPRVYVCMCMYTGVLCCDNNLSQFSTHQPSIIGLT